MLTDAARERRRRELRLRRRRRDLLVDVALGLLIALIALSLAPGLGFVALIAVPVAAILLGVRLVSVLRRWWARR
jgi:hypothetical protein